MNASHLYRSRQNRVIAGVAGGLADYFGIDGSLIRLIWIIAIFCGGTGLLAYLIAWVIIPERKTVEPQVSTTTATSEENQEKTAPEDSAELNPAKPDFYGYPMFGLILIGLGLFLLLKTIFPWHWFKYSWPVLLIVCGLWLLLKPKKA